MDPTFCYGCIHQRSPYEWGKCLRKYPGSTSCNGKKYKRRKDFESWDQANHTRKLQRQITKMKNVIQNESTMIEIQKRQTLSLEKRLEKRLKKQVLNHWYENLMILQLNYLSKSPTPIINITTSSNDCAFCKMFLPGCTLCPIYKKTGLHACQNTPYWNVVNKLEPVFSYQEIFNAITNEINFLESL